MKGAGKIKCLNLENIMHEILTSTAMAKADRLTIEGGIAGFQLMENAGKAVADAAKSMVTSGGKILIVAGTGNNGGDGFITARLLQEADYKVSILMTGDKGRLQGDAKRAFETIADIKCVSVDTNMNTFDLIIDALFGAGLNRDIEGQQAELISQINKSGIPVLAIDLPSGVDGNSGVIRGIAVKAAETVTFFRLKAGHLLLPGRVRCGQVLLTQIGMKSDTLAKIPVIAQKNSPDWWRSKFPVPRLEDNKYQRGHVLCIAGPLEMSGAARLMAGAALRSGAGLVTLGVSGSALLAHACHTTSIMLHKLDPDQDITKILKEKRINCVALGPGLPPNEHTRNQVLSFLDNDGPVLLDAGALSAFHGHSQLFFNAVGKHKSPIVLTPHDGEFKKLFPDLVAISSKIQRAREAARRCGAIILLKGADTVIATPTGDASISNNAPPFLATAGSGDVLSGLIAGLLAQSMPAFLAVNAAVWLHGQAANWVGPGLISSDLDEGLKKAISRLVQALDQP